MAAGPGAGATWHAKAALKMVIDFVADALKVVARQMLGQVVLEKQQQQEKQQAQPATATSASMAEAGAKPLKEPKLLDDAAQPRPRDEL